MAEKFMEMMLTPAVLAAQDKSYGRHARVGPAPERDPLGEEEIEFISRRDSFYMATVTETGWPYVQHRGGKPGFLHVISPTQLAFADFRGNRQLLSTGNLAATDRVALFLMDYPQQTRLKILGHARVEMAREHPELVTKLADEEEQSMVERLFFIEVVSYDWNCPQHITPRFTVAEIEKIIEPLKRRIGELEEQLKAKS